MKVIDIKIIDDFLLYPDFHLSEVMDGSFESIDALSVDTNEKITFHGIQQLGLNDQVGQKIMMMGYDVLYNFVRMSPKDQQEPTHIHKDDMMGEYTAILYLSKIHPDDDGTTLYDDDMSKKNAIFMSKFNRLLIFPSDVYHSRNIFSNFGVGKDSRIIQVLFLNKR